MQTYNAPALFDEVGLTEDDHQFLYQKEVRIKGIVMQSALDIGRELAEVRDRLRHKHDGFEGWVETRLGYSRSQAYSFIQVFEQLASVQHAGHLDIALRAQLQLVKAPDPQEAVNEVLLRQQLEEEITAKKVKEIADYQRAERIARDAMRSAQERAEAVDRQLAYVKQQLVTAQKPREVVPPHVQEHIRQLEDRQRQLTRERDSYRTQLEQERTTSYAHQAERREGENADRIRALFAEATRDYLRFTRVFISKLPSLADTGVFEADDWQRLNEVREVMRYLEKELDKLTARPAEPTQMFIVDATLVGE